MKHSLPFQKQRALDVTCVCRGVAGRAAWLCPVFTISGHRSLWQLQQLRQLRQRLQQLLFPSLSLPGSWGNPARVPSSSAVHFLTEAKFWGEVASNRERILEFLTESH